MSAGHPTEVTELLGAYALDAVTPAERALVESYLETDAAARLEADELRETASLLALAHVSAEPVPDSLWTRIVAEIDDQDAPGAAVASSSNVVPIEQARRRTRRTVWRTVAIAAAVALVAGVGIGIALRGSSSSNLESAYKAAQRHGVALHVLDTASKRVDMADITLDTRIGSGYVRNRHMGALPAGEVYQLWVIPRGASAEPVSVGVLGAKPADIAMFHWTGAMQAMAVSVERAPGSPTPTRVVAASA